jgi:GT2 family glycosyltransferase
MLDLQLSIIIVNYNVKYFLEQCLYSVQKACTGIKAEVFVVDNHSADGSREYLSSKFPKVVFKWNMNNDGFGKASNSVLKETKGDYILFLNPDTIVPEDCFEKCLSFFEKNQNCGSLGVHMLDGSGRFLKESKRGFPSPLISLFKMAGLAGLFPSSKIFARYYEGHLPKNKNNEVDVLSGAFMMLSKKAISLTGGFDENFFMYGEDVDLSFRIKKAGLSNYYLSETCILHFKGESTQKISSDYIKHFYGAMELFVKKHYSNKKAMIFFMKNAIALSKMIAAVKTKITSKRSNTSNPDIHLNTAVVAGQQKFNECLHLIKHATPPILIAGRIGIDLNDKDAAIGNIDVIESCIKKNEIEQLLFCEGEISYKMIIQLTEKLSGKTNFLFHANQSNSIVGSNDKKAKGIFIVKP